MYMCCVRDGSWLANMIITWDICCVYVCEYGESRAVSITIWISIYWNQTTTTKNHAMPCLFDGANELCSGRFMQISRQTWIHNTSRTHIHTNTRSTLTLWMREQFSWYFFFFYFNAERAWRLYALQWIIRLSLFCDRDNFMDIFVFCLNCTFLNACAMQYRTNMQNGKCIANCRYSCLRSELKYIYNRNNFFLLGCRKKYILKFEKIVNNKFEKYVSQKKNFN